MMKLTRVDSEYAYERQEMKKKIIARERREKILKGYCLKEVNKGTQEGKIRWEGGERKVRVRMEIRRMREEKGKREEEEEEVEEKQAT